MNIIGGLLSLLIKFVFRLILKLFDIIFMPFIAIFLALFPDVSTITTQVLAFVTTYIFPNLKFVISLAYNLFGIPPVLFLFLSTYIMFMFTAKASSIAITFALNVYEKLKP